MVRQLLGSLGSWDMRKDWGDVRVVPVSTDEFPVQTAPNEVVPMLEVLQA